MRFSGYFPHIQKKFPFFSSFFFLTMANIYIIIHVHKTYKQGRIIIIKGVTNDSNNKILCSPVTGSRAVPGLPWLPGPGFPH